MATVAANKARVVGAHGSARIIQTPVYLVEHTNKQGQIEHKLAILVSDEEVRFLRLETTRPPESVENDILIAAGLHKEKSDV